MSPMLADQILSQRLRIIIEFIAVEDEVCVDAGRVGVEGDDVAVWGDVMGDAL